MQFILVEANIIIACIRLCYHWISNFQEEAIALIIFTRHILIHVPGHDTDVHLGNVVGFFVFKDFK